MSKKNGNVMVNFEGVSPQTIKAYSDGIMDILKSVNAEAVKIAAVQAFSDGVKQTITVSGCSFKSGE